MPINNRQDFVILDLIQQAVRNVRAMPVNLGGVSGVGGGEGTPPGGFIGLLAQTKVAYDSTEAAYSGILSAPSGTLVDNLAHIRYRLNLLEAGSGGGGSPLTVDDYDGIPSISNVDHITFSGGVISNLGLGHVLVEVGSGGSGADSSAIHTNVANEISGLTEKTTLSSNDVLIIEDSDASFVKKKSKKSTLVSSIWSQVVNETGTSFTNFTSVSGSWSSDGTVIKQTNTSSSTSKSRLTSPVANAGCVVQADVQFKTNAADAHVGVLIHFTGGTNSIFVYPRLQEDDVRVEQEGTAEASLYTGYTINIDTWYTLRVVVFGNVIDTYLNGTLVGSTVITQVNAAGRYVGLATTNTEGWFRNIKVWNLALPA